MAEYENQNQAEYTETHEAPVSGESAPEANDGSNWQDCNSPYNHERQDNDTWNHGPQDNGPYNHGLQGNEPYNNGPYNNGPYNNGPYNHGPYIDGPYNNGPYYNPYNPYNTPKPPKQKNGFATAALICGILGLLNLCCFSFPTSIFLGVGAISCAVISRKEQHMTGTATAGMILGVIAILLGIGEFFYSLWLADLFKDPEYAAMFNQLVEQFEQQLAQPSAK